MQASYWHDKWTKNDIKFHQDDYNPLMVKHFRALDLAQGACVFVPLCGKTRDIKWLLDQGYRVVGAELSETAVKDLFADLGLTPAITQDGSLTRYATMMLVVYVGDIFALSARALGPVDAVFDRAALVALPDEMRDRYAAQVMAISDKAPQFVITYDYDQSAMPGPPFSIPETVFRGYFEGHYAIEKREVVEIAALKGQVPAIETAWLLVGQKV